MRRVLGVTAFVAALGAIGGALGGVVIAGIIALDELIRASSQPADAVGLFGAVAYMASVIGAAAGVVLGPLFAWTLLRRAPVWRAIGETACGAALGTGLALVFVPSELALWLAPLVASSAAALRLRVEVDRSGTAELAAGAG